MVFEHRFEEAGPRRTKVNRTSTNFVAGIEGEAAEFDIAAAYRLGRNIVNAAEFSRLDLARLETALDPQACANAAGCRVADFFGADRLSDDTLQYITIPKIDRKLRLTEHEFTAGFSRAFNQNNFEAGSVAAGIEFRRSGFSDADDLEVGVIPIGYLGGEGSSGSQTTFAIYSALQKRFDDFFTLPGSVDILLAARAMRPSHKTYIGNFESEIDWSPNSWVSLHARQQIGRRAPDVFDLHYRGPTLYERFSDPCAPQFRENTIDTNCSSEGALGVAPGFVQTANLTTISPIANPDLKPERINSRAYGLTLNPSILFGLNDTSLSVSATWIDIGIKGGIGQQYDELFLCYASISFSSSACAPDPITGEAAIVRDPKTGQTTKFIRRLQNLTDFSWRGLDLELKYRQELPPDFPAEAIWLSALHTYTHRVTRSVTRAELEHFSQGDPIVAPIRLDGLIDHPHHRTLFSAGATKGAFSVAIFGTRRGAARTADIEFDNVQLSPAWYVDLSGRVDIGQKSYLQLSIENVGDKQPEISAFNDFGNFAPQYYDPIGRRFSISFKSEL